MIILSFTGFLRYDELSNIRCHNVSFIDNSHVKIRIEKTKQTSTETVMMFFFQN